jgi:hypothetical protein
MHSGITKIYDKKPVGRVFTKPVQIEGTTQIPTIYLFIFSDSTVRRLIGYSRLLLIQSENKY